MSYKPDEALLMAYVYDELQGEERGKVAQYVATHPEVRVQLEQLQFVRHILNKVEDKEVIAPPIVMDDTKQRFWNGMYFKTVISIAASLILLVLVGKMTGLQIDYANSELRIGYGNSKPILEQPVLQPMLTAQQVQNMIDASVQQNNLAVQTALEKSQQRMDESIRMTMNSSDGKMSQLVQQISSASEDQIRQYALAMQSENKQLMKDYLQLTSNEQKQYIEDLLVDFSKYMQQQRVNDLTVLQTRLNAIEQNTDLFKQETEQLLTSIIANAESSTGKTTKY